MSPEQETPLAGGNVNPGVVRIGDTVRRRQTPHSSTIHHLLQHLAAEGFTGSPRFLGVDADDREILSYIPGPTGIPLTLWRGPAPLIAAANLLRSYHAAAATFVPPPGATWAFTYPDPYRREVICHNDFAPYNFIYATDTDTPAPAPPGLAPIPIAVIDFDLAGPGPRRRDVAYAAYWLAPLSFSADIRDHALADLSAGSPRLKLFCQTYGIAADLALLDMVQEVLTHMGDEPAVRRMIGPTAAEHLKAGGHLAHWQREAAAFRAHREVLAENLQA